MLLAQDRKSDGRSGYGLRGSATGNGRKAVALTTGAQSSHRPGRNRSDAGGCRRRPLGTADDRLGSESDYDAKGDAGGVAEFPLPTSDYGVGISSAEHAVFPYIGPISMSLPRTVRTTGVLSSGELEVQVHRSWPTGALRRGNARSLSTI